MIAEECLSTMCTVRSFACEEEEGAWVGSGWFAWFGCVCVGPDPFMQSQHDPNRPNQPTVKLYKAKLDEYYGLNKREGRAYGAYAVATTLLPNLVRTWLGLCVSPRSDPSHDRNTC